MKLYLFVFLFYLLFTTSCHKKDPNEEGCFGPPSTQQEAIDECWIAIAFLDEFDSSLIGNNKLYKPDDIKIQSGSNIISHSIEEFRKDEYLLKINYFFLPDRQEHQLFLSNKSFSMKLETWESNYCGVFRKDLFIFAMEDEILYPTFRGGVYKQNTYEYHQ